MITCGLPATGKTTAARSVSALMDLPVIATDLVRLDMLGEAAFDEVVASDMSTRLKVYEEVFRRAEKAAAEAKGLIIDATFGRQNMRKRAANIATRDGRRFAIMETTCPEDTAIGRIRARTRERSDSNAITERAYFNSKSTFESIDIADLKRVYPSLELLYFTIDTKEDSPEDWHVVRQVRQ